MNRLLLVAISVSLMLMSASASALTLTFTQNPDPFQAFEGTTGNIGFLNVTNTGSDRATITDIHITTVLHTGGEFDDQATNVVYIGPNPTAQNPMLVAAGGNFNIKFTWDAVDTIKDNDVDFGLWQVNVLVTGLVPLDFVLSEADLRVNDTPLPSALPLFATALGTMGFLGWRRKRKGPEGFDMKSKFLGIIAGFALFTLCSAHSAQAFTLLMDQNPNPFQAFEGTPGNIGFLTLTNFGSSDITITGITGVITPFGGELDDQATNLNLIMPTAFPFVLPGMTAGVPLSNFNIKFSWDAVDNTKDNDVDFGIWHASFALTGSQTGRPPTDEAFAVLRVNDTPLPAALPLFATGLGALGLLGWRRKRKNAAAVAA